MAPKRAQKQGKKALCEMLKLINEVSNEVAADKNASATDRKEAVETAAIAKKDGRRWGCRWAK
jgi:hypothetical protein